jgi:hypothetical protein
MQIERILAVGESVTAETSFNGKIAGTSDPLSIAMCYIYDFDNGKVVDVREYT